jgi:beta-N-acetylhexosaminidase
MNKKLFLLLCCIFGCFVVHATDSLRYKIAQMLIIGFRGGTLSSDNHIYSDIKDLHIGGVVLFDYDTPTKTYNRNIFLPSQLQKLCTDLQMLAGGNLFISIDQEGGKVNRLKASRGFKQTPSAQYLGQIDNTDTTSYYARRCAEQLKMLGFNLNFAPCVDININPDCPIVGKVQRSYSVDPKIVLKHSSIWIEVHHRLNIPTSIKQFPGHGSSNADTHIGIADITNTWQEKIEFFPYRYLIAYDLCDMIMVSHVFNRNLDADYPASLSHKVITGIIRKKLKFNGLVITDDLAMGAIANHYSLQTVLEKTINAGTDMLILSNNGSFYEPSIAAKAIDIIEKLVENGTINPKRIDEAYKRISNTKKRYIINPN